MNVSNSKKKQRQKINLKELNIFLELITIFEGNIVFNKTFILGCNDLTTYKCRHENVFLQCKNIIE